MTALRVRIREPRNPPRELEVLPGATIGRASDNDVVVEDTSVSRHHVRVEHKDSQWVVRDLGSRSGTGLPGQILKRDEEAPIESGTRLRLGDTDLEVVEPLQRGTRIMDAAAVDVCPDRPRPAEATSLSVPPLRSTDQREAEAQAETRRAGGLEFRILLIDGAERRLISGRTPALIGRGRNVDLRMRDESVSAAHAQLDRDGGRLVIMDQGSTNGTWLAAERIRPHVAVPLSSPCALRLGQVELWITTTTGTRRSDETRAVRHLLRTKVLSRAEVRAAQRACVDLSPGEALLLKTRLTIDQWMSALRGAKPSLAPLFLAAIVVLVLLIACIAWFL